MKKWKPITMIMLAFMICVSLNITETFACGSHDNHCCTSKRGTVNIKVTKQWCNDTEKERPKCCTMILYANGREADRVNVSEKTGWKHTWRKLPKYNSCKKEIKYTVKEVPIKGYTTTYSKMTKVGSTCKCCVCGERHQSRCHSSSEINTCYKVTVKNTKEQEKEMLYHVKYDLNGGTGVTPVDAKEYHEADIVTVTTNDQFTRQDGFFSGYWSTEPLPLQKNSTFVKEDYYAGGSTFAMGKQDVTLYAIYLDYLD